MRFACNKSLPGIAMFMVMLVAMLVVMFMAMLGLFTGAALAGGVRLPEPPRGKGEVCVAPTEMMRKNHFRWLNHQRDLTVHNGIRSGRHSLVRCVQCHVQTDADGRFIAIDAPGQFCQTCHAFTAVKPDCFECHANTPDES